MNSHELWVMVPILITMSICGLIFGIVYLRNRERMAMIERGMDPRLNKPKVTGYSTFTLTWGLLLIGAGLGLFLAFVLDFTVFKNVGSNDNNPAIYFALIAIFGGGGLFLSHLIEKKDISKEIE